MKIKRLDKSIVSRIAAGEVITGVYSVVKELIENSIDAGADRIVVELINGGKSEIKVQDNGEGMEKDDLLVCYESHTTSKIDSFQDIYTLNSFGFRGEALYSICQISKTTIFSKTASSNLGHEIEVVAGHLVYEKPVQIEKGTTVIVRDLFFNVPARRKFLKSNAVEARMAVEVFERFCLSHPHINLILTKDQQVVYNLPATTLIQRIKALFPDIPMDSLKAIQSQWKDMELHGCAVSPANLRRKKAIFTFVNDRFVVNQLLQSAIYSAYADFLHQKEHPVVIVNLFLPPKDIDVNVHPQKIEVKFSRDEEVFRFVRDSIKSQLKIPIIHHISRNTPAKVQERQVEYKSPNAKFTTTSEEMLIPPEDFKIIGIVRKRYIIVETEDELFIVDFHAAHERLIYNKMLSSLNQNDGTDLLIPVQIELRESELALIEKNNVLKQIGFDYEIIKNQLIVKKIPTWLDQSDVKRFIIDSIDEIKLIDIYGLEEVMKKIIADISCKSALRTRDRLDLSQAKYLVREIFANKISTCPHGRPVMYSINFKELDSFFERI